jgi:hypothetical protein
VIVRTTEHFFVESTVVEVVKVALRKYLNTHFFYSVDEFFIYKEGS